MIPGTGWLPVMAGDSSFEPLPVSSPVPVQGTYLTNGDDTFSAAPENMLLTIRALGNGNNAFGYMGPGTVDARFGLVVLTMGSVFGTVLVDRITVHTILTNLWDVCTPRPDGAWSECA
jgi:hypothetical protein